MHLGVMVVLDKFEKKNKKQINNRDGKSGESCRFFMVSEDYTEYYLRRGRFGGSSSVSRNDYSDSNPLVASIPLQFYL